jgi:hypothetical protein
MAALGLSCTPTAAGEKLNLQLSLRSTLPSLGKDVCALRVDLPVVRLANEDELLIRGWFDLAGNPWTGDPDVETLILVASAPVLQ